MRSKLLYLGILLVFILGCNDKEDSIDGEVVYLDSSVDPFKFDVGTYWIYEDSVSKNTDSVFVSKVDSGFYWNPPPIHGVAGTRRQFYKLYYESSTTGVVDTDLLSNTGIRRNTELEWEVCGRKYYTNQATSGFEKIDSISIYGVQFYEVVKKMILAEDHDPACSNSGFLFDTELYTAPGYGIIKRVEYKNDSVVTWNLLRWNIRK